MISYSPSMLSVHLLFKEGQGVPLAMPPAARSRNDLGIILGKLTLLYVCVIQENATALSWAAHNGAHGKPHAMAAFLREITQCCNLLQFRYPPEALCWRKEASITFMYQTTHTFSPHPRPATIAFSALVGCH